MRFLLYICSVFAPRLVHHLLSRMPILTPTLSRKFRHFEQQKIAHTPHRSYLAGILCAMSFFFVSGQNFAQNSSAQGIVKGSIKDAETGQALVGAAVRVEARAFGAYSNKSGEFRMNALPAGEYMLLVSLVGYELKKIPVSVRAQDSTVLAITLRAQILKTNDVVVSAGKRVQAAQDVPVSITTVDSKMLQQRNITRVDEALRYIPGVYVSRDQINIRGSSGFSLGFGSRVSVFMDGFSMLSADGGDVKFDVIPMFNVERIEVVKGAGSALYGTGALGGVVNVITAQPSETPEFRFRGFGGAYTLPRFEEWRWRETMPLLGGADVSYSQKIGDVGVLAAVGVKGNQGHLDYFDNWQWNVFTKLSFELSPRSSMNVLFTHAYDDRTNWVFWKSLREATRPPLGTNYNERFVSSKTMLAADFKTVFDEKFFMTARLGAYRTDFTTQGQSLAGGQTQIQSVANAFNTEIQLTSIVDSTFLLTYGVMGTFNAIEKSPIISAGTPTQLIAAAYLQGEYKPMKNLTLTLGSRFDAEQTSNGVAGSGIIVSPKAGASWVVSEQTQLRASVGAGFRAPTLTERFAALRFGSFSVAPNPGMRSERSWSFEIGGKQSFTLFGEEWSVDAALFNNEFTDLVEPRLPDGTNPQIQFINITQARISGAELALTGWLPMRLLGFETSLTAMSPRDVKLDKVLKYRSELLWYSRAIVPIGAFQFQVDYRYQSRFQEVDDLSVAIRDATARVPIHVVDARVIANMFELVGLPMVLTLNVRNALDYYYNEIIGNLAPTRHITLQVDMKL
ncbi:MAG: TonB-dependent receptor [Candidatus Kapaibacterium sp.]|nr:MAG: TonB-dependent receptor [Candidatus Kapabacteria bacterium]